MTRTPRPLYREIASTLQAYQHCERIGNEWIHNHYHDLHEMVKMFMPSGSGIDNGIKLDTDESKPDKLVFTFSYHHMNENGMYDGWTDHKCIVTPSLVFEIDLRITGPNRNDVKDYLYETFRTALTSQVWADENGKWMYEAFGAKVPV